MFEERIDIKVAPYNKWGKLIFVDGKEAWIYGMTPKKDSLGRDVYEMTLKPFPLTIKRDNIGFDEFFDKMNLLIKMSYPVETIKLLNQDPSGAVWFCLLNFRGQETISSSLFDIKDYVVKIDKLKMEIQTKDSEIAYQKEQLRKQKTNTMGYIKENAELFAPMIRQMFGYPESGMGGIPQGGQNAPK